MACISALRLAIVRKTAITASPAAAADERPALERARAIAREVVLALGGYGLFGVELFVCGDEVIFSEVSPRPHDTGW